MKPLVSPLSYARMTSFIAMVEISAESNKARVDGGRYSGLKANFAFVGPQPEYAPAPFRRHRACTIC
jgi:hypothetical protein